MKARSDVIGGRFPRPTPLEGLAGPAGRVPWVGLPLRERQERAMLEVGVAVADTLPDAGDRGRVLVREDVTLTHQAVTALIERGSAEGRDIAWRAGGRTGGFAGDIALGDAGPWLVWLAPGGGEDTDARIAAAEPVEFDPKERLLEFAVPRSQFGADVLELPLSDQVVLPTGHWLQLLWANLLGLPPFLWRTLAGRNVVAVAWNIGTAVLATRSVDPRVVSGRLWRRGKNCRIHPTAVVEGCWLGDDVDIGANAIVRASVLADGAAVEELAMVEGCVLGPGARAQRMAMVKYSVLAERAVCGGISQLSVLDRDAAVKLTATLMDQGLGQGVRVQAAGALRRAPIGLAGVCVGEGSVVGAGVQIAPGRCLPPGLEILPPPGDVVSRIPDGASGKLVVRDGTLVPA
jgi:carbonic anhydrase/acetyltransferase-like protein (isoleucine patch superfamily)